MRVPYRKPGKYSQLPMDPIMSEKKFCELKSKLDRLQRVSRPRAITEMSRLAETGDFSENAGYQAVKGRLRGINQAIMAIEIQIKQAVIVEQRAVDGKVRIGNLVTVETNNTQKTYQILGSSESSPSKGIISHTSPLGSALLGARSGDDVIVKLTNKIVKYKIIKVE